MWLYCTCFFLSRTYENASKTTRERNFLYDRCVAKDGNPLKYTLGSVSFIQKEAQTFLFVTGIVMQVVTTLFYAAMVAVSWTDITKEIIYALLFAGSVALFIIGLVRAKKEKAQSENTPTPHQLRRASTIIKLINYVLRLALIGLAVWVILTEPNVSNGFLLATIISGILFMLGLLIELVVFVSLRYVDYITYALKRDIEENGIINAGKTIADPMSLVERWTSKWAGKAEKQPERTPKEQAMEENILAQREADLKQKEKLDAEKKQQQKAERKARRGRIKENIKTIWHNATHPKKKEKKDDNQAS